jgi:hypothetical protein
MHSRAPAARWVATATVIAVLAVLIALAVRMKLGEDPALGTVNANAGASSASSPSTSDDRALQDLFGDDDGGASAGGQGSFATPSSPPTSRAS